MLQLPELQSLDVATLSYGGSMGFAGDEGGSETRLSIPITFITSPHTHVLRYNHLVSFTISF